MRESFRSWIRILVKDFEECPWSKGNGNNNKTLALFTCEVALEEV